MKRIFFTFMALSLAFPVYAQSLSIIRDTEIEHALTHHVQNIFSISGLNPKNASVVLINDDSINAFVAGGHTIFVHTGLITHAKNIDDVIFVLAHETGHILGGHVVRGTEQIKSAQTTALISSVLGGLLAVAGGSPEAALAIMLGSQSSVTGMLMSYRQSEENTADRIAVDIMQKTGYSLKGFRHIMKEIQHQERLNADNINVYMRTHPVTQERIQNLERFIKSTPPLKEDLEFHLIKAKLIGFLYPPHQTRLKYTGDTVADRYAMAIADYKDHKINQSLKKLDALIHNMPNNPYFHELKGQFLFETGQLKDAISSYQQAIQLSPNSPLIHLALGHAYMETNQKNYLKNAINHLTQAIQLDKRLINAWRLLSICYGKLNNIPMADYAMAEFYFGLGDKNNSKRFAERALNKLSVNDAAYHHTQDILSILNQTQLSNDY